MSTLHYHNYTNILDRMCFNLALSYPYEHIKHNMPNFTFVIINQPHASFN